MGHCSNSLVSVRRAPTRWVWQTYGQAVLVECAKGSTGGAIGSN